jgi:hypothetical protein
MRLAWLMVMKHNNLIIVRNDKSITVVASIYIYIYKYADMQEMNTLNC